MPFERLRMLALAALAVGVSACGPQDDEPQPNIQTDRALYVATTSGTGGIGVFAQAINANTVPQIPPGIAPLPSGAPLAMRVAGTTLYVATGGSQVEQYAIDPATRALSLRNSTPFAGGAPFEMTNTASAIYVAALDSANAAGGGRILSFAIDATGNLAAPQTTAIANVKRIATDDAGRFLFAAVFPDLSATSGQVCVFPIGAGGALPAMPSSCVTPSGSAQSMTYSNGVLYMLLRGVGPTGAPNDPNYYVSAWTVDSTTGALTQRGANLDVNRANVGTLTASADGRFLFLPRQGGFDTIGTADPLAVVAQATPVTGSNSCVWPPVGGGHVAVVPGEQVLYVADPVSAPSGASSGAHVSELAIGPNGELTPRVCNLASAPISAIAFWKQ